MVCILLKAIYFCGAAWIKVDFFFFSPHTTNAIIQSFRCYIWLLSFHNTFYEIISYIILPDCLWEKKQKRVCVHVSTSFLSPPPTHKNTHTPVCLEVSIAQVCLVAFINQTDRNIHTPCNIHAQSCSLCVREKRPQTDSAWFLCSVPYVRSSVHVCVCVYRHWRHPCLRVQSAIPII